MDLFQKMLFVFMFGAVLGWLLEFAFRSLKSHRFINPGFLVGFALPIYGVGATILYLLSSFEITFIDKSAVYFPFLLFAVATLVMTLIELGTGIFFLNVYHTRLWDYTKMWGNYKGVICPLFSLIWGLISVGFYYLLFPLINRLIAQYFIGSYQLIFLGFAYGVFAVDVGYSFDLFGRIRKKALELRNEYNYENLKVKAKEFFNKKRGRPHSPFLFRLYTSVKRYLNENDENGSHKPEKDSSKGKNNQ